jgi:long-chain acyl-CoA synthetase
LIYDKLVFEKIRNVLGGNIRLLISGGAPLSKEVFKFLKAAFSCPVIEAYGSTETAGCLTSTSLWETKAGVIGGPLPCIKLKLRDLPELGYMTTDNPPSGEICIKGNSVFKGYFRNPALTAEVLDSDGWLSMGDVAVLLPSGCLQLVDRVRSICKLQHGEYVAPAFLENVYGQSQAVAQIFVSADWRSEAVVAIIVPEKDYLLRKLCKAEGRKDLNHYNNITPQEY